MTAFDLRTHSGTDLQTALAANRLTTRQLMDLHLDQIAAHNHAGAGLNAILQVTPRTHLEKLACTSDAERKAGNVRGPLHGLPVVVKDNYCTPSYPLFTTLGSLAFQNSTGKREGVVVQRLRNAGAIIIGKGNLNEYGGAKQVQQGWSPMGGLTRSPYARGEVDMSDCTAHHMSTLGSSSGSAVAVAAGFAPYAIGTETLGSVVYPAARAGVYGMTTSRGAISDHGVAKFAKAFDCQGGFGRTATDLADLLSVMMGDASINLPLDGAWHGRALGVLDPERWIFPPDFMAFNEIVHRAQLDALARAVGDITSAEGRVEQVDMPNADEMAEAEGLVNYIDLAAYDLKEAFERTLSDDLDTNDRFKTLADIIKFDKDHAELELPYGFNNDYMQAALDSDLTEETYRENLDRSRTKMRELVYKTMDDARVDALVAMGDSELCHIAAVIGSPTGSVPLGFADDYNGRAFGLHVLVRPGQERLLLEIMAAWEKTCPWTRRVPSLQDRGKGIS